jgi:hypothetical protein
MLEVIHAIEQHVGFHVSDLHIMRIQMESLHSLQHPPPLLCNESVVEDCSPFNEVFLISVQDSARQRRDGQFSGRLPGLEVGFPHFQNHTQILDTNHSDCVKNIRPNTSKSF